MYVPSVLKFNPAYEKLLSPGRAGGGGAFGTASALITLQLQVPALALGLETSMPAGCTVSEAGHCRSQLCASFQCAPVMAGPLALLSANATAMHSTVATTFPMVGNVMEDASRTPRPAEGTCNSPPFSGRKFCPFLHRWLAIAKPSWPSTAQIACYSTIDPGVLFCRTGSATLCVDSHEFGQLVASVSVCPTPQGCRSSQLGVATGE